MTNLYDLVLEYDRNTKVITKRIELQWYYESYYQQWQPPYGHEYDEYTNQFTPYIAIRKKHNIQGVRPESDGKYEGDFDSIKVGDVITDEMFAASYMIEPNTKRSDEYGKLKVQVEHYQLLGGPKPDFKRYLASSWVYGHITYPHIENAARNGLITIEDSYEIMAIRPRKYSGVPIV